MKKAVVSALVIGTLISGCSVTRKIPMTAGAEQVSAITSADDFNGYECKLIGTHTIVEAHPNNVIRELKNETYARGGNRYKVVTILSGKNPKPSGVVAELYQCKAKLFDPMGGDQSTTGQIRKVIPGAETVQPLSFAEVENNQCKLIGSKRVDMLSTEQLSTELANQAYMMGGNRYHVTQITPPKGDKKGNVNADVYRCRHQTVKLKQNS